MEKQAPPVSQYPPPQGYVQPTPAQSYNPSAPPASGHGYPPSSPQGYPPSSPQGYPPQGHPPQGYPPQGYPPHGGYSNSTVVVQTTAPTVGVVVSIRFGEYPVAMTCPNCRAQIQTRTMYELGLMTWLMALALWFFTGCCCWIAFLIDGFKDVRHQCPNCNSNLGLYTRI